MTSINKYSLDYSLDYVEQKIDDMLRAEREIWKQEPNSAAQKRRCNDLADIRDELIKIRNEFNDIRMTTGAIKDWLSAGQ